MNRILSILINLLIFSLPFGVVFRFSLIDNVYLYPHDVIAGAIFFVVAINFARDKLSFLDDKILIFASLFVFFAFLSLIFNLHHLTDNEFLVSAAYLVRYIAYLSIIFSFKFLDKKLIDSLAVNMTAAGMLFVVFGYIQYFLYGNLRNLYYLGWDEHLYRLFSTFLDPNFAGAFLVLILIMIVSRLLVEKMNRRDIIILSTSAVFGLGAIFLTYSRSAFIMLIVATVLTLWVNNLKKILIIALTLLVIIFFAFSNTNFEGLNPFRVASIQARFDSVSVALEIISKNPIFGVGFNAYRYAQERYGLMVQGEFPNNAGAGTDNSFLFVIATSGIVGFIFFAGFWLNILKKIKILLGNNDYLPKVAFISIISIFVNSLFINSLFYTSIMAWIFILIGATLNRKR